MSLTGENPKPDPMSDSIHEGHDLAGQSPFWAPEAHRWAGMIGPSTDTIDSSQSPDHALKISSQRSALTPRRNRQRPPSRHRRLSTAVRPGSVTWPGHSDATRAHISSVKTVRSAFIISPAWSARAATFGVRSQQQDTPSTQDARQLSTGLNLANVPRRIAHNRGVGAGQVGTDGRAMGSDRPQSVGGNDR